MDQGQSLHCRTDSFTIQRMKIHAAAISSPLANSGSPTVSAEGVRESAGGRSPDVARLTQNPAGAQTSAPSSQPAVRTDRMASISDDSWMSDPPALNTGMLEEIKAAIREGRFMIDDRAVARALAEDALR